VVAPSPVLSPEQHARLMVRLMTPLPAASLAQCLRDGEAYRRKRYAEWLAQPGWEEFAKAGEHAERWLAEHGLNLEP